MRGARSGRLDTKTEVERLVAGDPFYFSEYRQYELFKRGSKILEDQRSTLYLSLRLSALRTILSSVMRNCQPMLSDEADGKDGQVI